MTVWLLSQPYGHSNYYLTFPLKKLLCCGETGLNINYLKLLVRKAHQRSICCKKMFLICVKTLKVDQRNWKQTMFCTHVLEDAHLKCIQIVHELTLQRGLICGRIFAFPNSKAKAEKTSSHFSLFHSNVADQCTKPVNLSQTGLSKLSQTGTKEELMINLLESESREQPITVGTASANSFIFW